MDSHASGASGFPFLQKITLKSPDVIWAELIRRLVEVLGELPDCQQVRPYGSLRVIRTLEFLHHHSSEMGHRDLLVIQNTAPRPRASTIRYA